MGRPKDSERWCKTGGCVLSIKHEGDCKVATTPNERSARENAAGPHDYAATLERLNAASAEEAARSGEPDLGSKPGAGWDAVAKASAANDAPPKKARKRGAKGEQMRMKVGVRDEVEVKAKHEIHRDMTDEEWREQSEILAHDRVELMTLEEEIAALKRKHAPRMKVLRENTAKGARQCDAKRWLSMVDCIEVHDVNRRTVTVYADVSGCRGAQVKPERVMRAEEYERALKGAPFEAPDDDAADPPDGPPVDADSAVPLDEDERTES